MYYWITLPLNSKEYVEFVMHYNHSVIVTGQAPKIVFVYMDKIFSQSFRKKSDVPLTDTLSVPEKPISIITRMLSRKEDSP